MAVSQWLDKPASWNRARSVTGSRLRSADVRCNRHLAVSPKLYCIGTLNHLFFWPEQYRRTGGMSIVFLFDENPDVASAGSGGAAVRGARSVPDHAARSNSERAVPSARVGNRFSAPQIVWNKSNRCAGERGGARVGRPRWLKNLGLTTLRLRWNNLHALQAVCKDRGAKMKHLVIALLVMVSLAARSFAASSEDRDRFDAIMYGGESYDDWRQITYWGKTSLSLRDYEYGSGDLEFLKLIVKQKTSSFSDENPQDDIQKHFLTEFKRLFGDLPFHDLQEGWNVRWTQFRRDNPQWDYEKNRGVDFTQAYDAFNAAELARRNALYGGRAGALFCNVRVKRRTFPVVYEIKCSISAEEDLRYARWRESEDIGFSTPELIDKEIKQAITRMLEKKNTELRKAKKYGKK